MWATVISCSANHRHSASASKIVACGGMWSVAPIESGVKMSRSSGSWLRPESIDTRSRALIAPCAACQAMKCGSGACAVRIPFGAPMLPEVKLTYASCRGCSSRSRGRTVGAT
jgi:hypothetical protein